jgi:hypothetical protein
MTFNPMALLVMAAVVIAFALTLDGQFGLADIALAVFLTVGLCLFVFLGESWRRYLPWPRKGALSGRQKGA